MTITEIKAFYQDQIAVHTQQLQQLKSKHRIWTMLRVAIFACIPLLFFVVKFSSLVVIADLVLLALFFKVVSIWADSKRSIEIEQNHLDLCAKELKALEGDWSGFAPHFEIGKGNHPFTYDMDVFSKNGLYTYINRTVTRQGAHKLASVLAEGVEQTDKYNRNISFLATKMEWVHQFIAQAHSQEEDSNDQKLSQLLQATEGKNQWSKIMQFLVPALALIALVANVFDVLSTGWFLISLAILFALSRAKASAVQGWMQVLDKERFRIVALKGQLEALKVLENESADTVQLYDEQLWSVAKELSVIQKQSAYRMNAVVNFILNAFLGWDARLQNRIARFCETSYNELDRLENHLAEVEVWISGAKMAFNNPDHTYAQWSEGDFDLQALCHPFVSLENRISNDFNLTQSECAIILTGPNMAGKSTYLRSVGTAILLANAGFPLFAKSAKLPRVHLYTSMRTSDDLLANSSYFHAELHRLRYIVDAIESGKKVFFILDEILKGTNSKDKEEGSALFLLKLKQLGAQGIIATHDLSLTNLSNVHSSFKNFYFDSTITGENLTFDYKIRAGVCQNMNASFLLRQLRLVND